MSHEGDSSSRLHRFLSNAALAGFVGLVGLGWMFYSDLSEKSEEIARQATQISYQATASEKQDVEIELAQERNSILSTQATLSAERAFYEEQLRTSPAINDDNYAPTATFIAIQSNQIEATSQAIQARQQEIEATQTAVSQPLLASSSGFSVSDADQVVLDENCNYWLSGIVIGEDGTGTSDNDVTFELTNYPSGYIVGDANMARIDGFPLGDSGVTFKIELSDLDERSELTLRNGVFFIVAPEDADGFLHLRMRNLECRGTSRDPVFYPPR